MRIRQQVMRKAGQEAGKQIAQGFEMADAGGLAGEDIAQKVGGGAKKGAETAKNEAEKLNNELEKLHDDLMKKYEEAVNSYGEAIAEALKRQKRAEIDTRKEAIQEQIDLLSDITYREITASTEVTEKKLQLIDEEFIAKTRGIDEGLAAALEAGNREMQQRIDIIALTDRESAARLQAIKDRTEAIETESREEKELIEAKNAAERLAELNKRITEAETDENRRKAAEELQKYQDDLEYKAREKRRAEEKKALEEESRLIIQAAKETAEEQTKIIAESQKKQQKLIKAAAADLKDGKYSADSEKQSLKSLEERYTEFEKTAENIAVKLVEAGEEGQRQALKILEKYYPDWKDKGKKFVNRLSDGFRENMNKSIEQAVKIGEESAKGVAKGLDSNAYLVEAAAARLADIIHDTLSIDLDINSPSRVTYKDGYFAGLGLALGLESMIPAVNRAAQKLGLAARPVLDNAGQFGAGMTQPVQLTINNNVSGIGADKLLYQLHRANKKAARELIGALI